MTKSLPPPTSRDAVRALPADYFVGRPDGGYVSSYRGPSTLVKHSGPYGSEEYFVVLDRSSRKTEAFNLIPNASGRSFHDALIALSVRVWPEGDLGDEALGACYSPGPESVQLTKEFVENHGLLQWDDAGCDCVGDQARLGEVAGASSVVYRLRENADELAVRVGRAFAGAGIGGRELRHGVAEVDAWIATLRATEDEQLVVSRFNKLHEGLSPVEGDPASSANSVSWILQEALSLRRAEALWDAIRHFQGEGSSDLLAALWRTRRGRLTLFESVQAPLKPRRQILIEHSLKELMRLLNRHIYRYAAVKVHYSGLPSATDLGLRQVAPRLTLTTAVPLTVAWLHLLDDILSNKVSGRVCQECRTLFPPMRADQRFCSKRCSDRHHQREMRAREKAKAGK